MEALERIDKQPDSFEEVDRILTIVEQAKSDFDQIEKREIRFMSVLALSILIVSVFPIGLFIYSKNVIDTFTLLIALLVGASNIVLLRHQFVLYKSKKKQYDLSVVQAIETIREIIPILSGSENWSSLRKFEIRLRLSKLDISPQGIMDDSRNL